MRNWRTGTTNAGILWAEGIYIHLAMWLPCCVAWHGSCRVPPPSLSASCHSGGALSASRFCHAQVPCKIPCKSLAVKRGCAKGSQWEHREIARKHDDIFAQLFTTKTALQTALQVPCKCRAEQNSTKSALQRRTLTLLEDPTLKWPHACVSGTSSQQYNNYMCGWATTWQMSSGCVVIVCVAMRPYA